jgi:hypothetical protein
MRTKKQNKQLLENLDNLISELNSLRSYIEAGADIDESIEHVQNAWDEFEMDVDMIRVK